jgi:hypothetical protein
LGALLTLSSPVTCIAKAEPAARRATDGRCGASRKLPMRAGAVSKSLLTLGLAATTLGACTTTATHPQLPLAAFVAN